MPLFVFSTNKPAANNDPSVDQPDMLQNNVSTNAIIDVDHFTFNDNQGGLHKQTQIVDQLTIPPGLLAGETTLYSKSVQVDIGPVNNSCLFMTPGISTNEYQLTRPINTDFATFGTFTVYDALVPNQRGGWTFLAGQQNASIPGPSTAGGLLLQYGRYTAASNGTQIFFPIIFTAIFSLVVTREQGNTGTTWGATTITNSSFVASNSSGGTANVHWMAIGV